jgi:hypothetical protein
VEKDNDVSVVKVRSLHTLNDPHIQEFMRKEREAYEAMQDWQKQILDAHDRYIYRTFILGE